MRTEKFSVTSPADEGPNDRVGGALVSRRDGAYKPGMSLPQLAPEALTEVLAKATDIAIVVEPDGAVASVLVNPNTRNLGSLDHWRSRDLREFLAHESVLKFEELLKQATGPSPVSRAFELNHSDGAAWEFPIRYTVHPMEEGLILMLGRDLRPIAEVQQQLAQAQIALERDHEAQREYDTRYRVLMNATSDAIVIMTLSGGRIADLNRGAAHLLGGVRDDLVGAGFAQEFEGGRGGAVLESLLNAAESGPVELKARRSRKQVRVTPTIFRAAGERLMLCRLDAAEPAGAGASEMAENLSGLYQRSADAIVFTDANGVIRSANDSFLALTEAADLAALKGRSLADFLARGGIDLKILTENAARAGRMRLYSTRIRSEHGADTAVEMSASHLDDRTKPLFAFIVRDVDRAEAARGAANPMSEEAAR
ncbi:MAG: transcriptional regulator PpsR, partial [Pseudomonadota bacterium]